MVIDVGILKGRHPQNTKVQNRQRHTRQYP